MQAINLRLEIWDYTNRVLGVIKEKFGLKDKSEALNKFAEIFGEQFVEKEVKAELVKEMVEECSKWEKEHRFKRKMSVKELDRLCSLSS